MKKLIKIINFILGFASFFACLGCAGDNASPVTIDSSVYSKASPRDNSPKVLVPESGNDISKNDVVALDYSYASDGYVTISYLGDNNKVKLQIIKEDGYTQTYNLSGEDNVFSLTQGNGLYTFTVYEHAFEDEYYTSFEDSLNIELEDEFAPFLYPNNMVSFNAASKSVATAAELTANCTYELDAISAIYHFVIDTLTYDDTMAVTIDNTYIPDSDMVLEKKSGICQDYAVLTACMLRSQGIPTKVIVGYADDACHEWISVYTKDTGWIDKFIEFNGKDYSLMDPTFADNLGNSSLKKYIGAGEHYTVKYTY